MKKVLLGLVIAVIMTGSGYSKEASRDACKWLKEKAVSLSEIAYAQDWEADRVLKNPYDTSTPKGEALLEADNYNYKLLREGQFTKVKDAHYYAVTWSALCD